MAKLSVEVLTEGRNFIRAKDLDGFITWIKANNITIDTNVVRSTYERIFHADDMEKAIKMFDAVFPDIDPVADIVTFFTKLLIKLLFIMGAIGGIVYLIGALL
jgi:SH3-like domain-containing protein